MADTGLAAYSRVIQQAGIPYQQYAPIAQYQPPKPSLWDGYRQLLAPPVEPTSHVQSAVTGMRHNLEAGAVAALLGVIHAKFGLDIKGKYPVDGILAAFFYALSVKEAGKPDGYSSDLRAISQSLTSVAVFRKTFDWAKPSVQTTGETVKTDSMSGHTSPAEDPLVAAAKRHGL